MVAIFRKNDVVNIFLLLPYAILLRLYSILHPTAYQIAQGDSVLARSIYSVISHPQAQTIVAIILVVMQAVIINILVNNHRLNGVPTALAGMFYILLASAIPAFQVLSPALMANTFVLLAIMFTFKTYKTTVAAGNIFNAAIVSVVAALIYAPYVFILIALLLGFTALRNFNNTERAQFLIGYVAILWIFGAALYHYDLLTFDWLSDFKLLGSISEINFRDRASIGYLVGALLFVLLSLFNYYNFMKKKGIEIRKKIDFFYWMLAAALLSILFYGGVDYTHLYILTIPTAIFLSMIFMSMRNKVLAELAHFVLVAGVFVLLFREYIDPVALNSF